MSSIISYETTDGSGEVEVEFASLADVITWVKLNIDETMLAWITLSNDEGDILADSVSEIQSLATCQRYARC